MQPPSPALARHILQRVGEIGQPPEIGIEYLNVGNERLLAVLEDEYLDPIVELGRGSSFKLVQAYFGGRTTPLLCCGRERAWRRGFASALVGLSPDECPFDDPVRIYQAVTLGAKRFPADEDGQLQKGHPRHPIVEDDVVIYAGATILGRITIGQGSTIGGNVWLTRSVPAGANITQANLQHAAGAQK